MARRSPQKLLTDLLVIVFGVLIALFAENEWGEFQARQAAAGYIDRLATELEANRSLLDIEVGWIAHTCSGAEALLAQFRGTEPSVEPTELLHLAVSAMGHRDVRYQRATFDDLIDTGSLRLIDAPELRAQVVETYTVLEAVETWRPSIDSPFRHAVVSVFPRGFIEAVAEECILEDDGQHFRASVRDCEVEPVAEATNVLLDRLRAVQGLTEDLSARAWTVCRYDVQLTEIARQFEALALLMDREAM